MGLEIKLLSIGGAICTDSVKGLAVAHRCFYRKSNNARTNIGKFVALLICFPIFQASHLLFKVAYFLNQRRLRLLCREDFFLKFYDRRIASGDIVDVLQSLRYIKSGLDGAEASEYFGNHATHPSP